MERALVFFIILALFTGCAQQGPQDEQATTTTSFEATTSTTEAVTTTTGATTTTKKTCENYGTCTTPDGKSGVCYWGACYPNGACRSNDSCRVTNEHDCIQYYGGEFTAGASCTTLAATTSTTTPPVKNNTKISLALNKGLVHSGEQITMGLKITSDKKMTDAEVRVYGIYAGRYRLNKSASVDIVPGENNLTLYYTAPPCNTCSGIAAGKYTIEAEVVYLDKVVARDIKEIEIMQ